METLPTYILLVFYLTTLLTIYFFRRSCPDSKIALMTILLWTIVQGKIGSTGFYTVTGTLPPRFILLIFPPILLMCFLFFTRKGKKFIDGLDLKALTLIHIVRIPVEFVLFWLYQQGKVPQIMTFEGRNFDILSGLTAPLIYYFGFIKNKLSRKLILGWNIICLGLLLNIMAHAILSAPSPFQQFAFDQPNIAVLYHPFIWLPCLIVPLVLFAHLVSIRRWSEV